PISPGDGRSPDEAIDSGHYQLVPGIVRHVVDLGPLEVGAAGFPCPPSVLRFEDEGALLRPHHQEVSRVHRKSAYPPATEGRMYTSSPSVTFVCSLWRSLMFSPLTKILT